MKALKVMVLGLFCYVLSTPSIASELVQEFSNPSFSGNGYSTHVLSLEQLRYSRENTIKSLLTRLLSVMKIILQSINLLKMLRVEFMLIYQNS
jgi:hypothetical protein